MKNLERHINDEYVRLFVDVTLEEKKSVDNINNNTLKEFYNNKKERLRTLDLVMGEGEGNNRVIHKIFERFRAFFYINAFFTIFLPFASLGVLFKVRMNDYFIEPGYVYSLMSLLGVAVLVKMFSDIILRKQVAKFLEDTYLELAREGKEV